MIQVVIDGKKTEVEHGTTIVDAAKKIGVFIPTLCHNEMLEPYGACRVCSVEIVANGRSKVVTACNYPIQSSIEVKTKSERAQVTRRSVLEMMLARWPEVKVIRDLAKFAGVEKPRFEHPLRNPDPNACILCGQCVRMCWEGVWHNVLTFEGRGASRRVVMPYGEVTRECVGCGACAAVCPTGAIQMVDDPNRPADYGRVRRAGMVMTRDCIVNDPRQNRMRDRGTTMLVEIMNDYDLLPVHNYKFGSHPEGIKIAAPTYEARFFDKKTFDGCHLGCDLACSKVVQDFRLKTGPHKGQFVLVDGPEYENCAGMGSNMGIFDPEAVLEMNYYCDHYGIDTISFGTSMAFVMECYELGVLNKDRTGGLELSFGAVDASLEVLHQMARGKGFGLTVGQGIRRMKKKFIKEYGADADLMFDIGMENKGLEYSEYVTKESLAQQGGYGIALKGAQHDEAWLIFMDMVNKQIPTFEDKAEALHYFPMWRTWFGLCGLCKLPWNDVEPEDNAETDAPHKVPKHTQAYADYFSGVTGREVGPDDLITMSERVYNFQRVFNLRQGFGTREHDAIPYRSVGPVTEEEYLSRQERYDKQLKEEAGLDPRKMSLEEKMKATRKHREEKYQKLLDAVYKRRGWTDLGIPTIEKARELGIDVADGLVELLKKQGLEDPEEEGEEAKKKGKGKKKAAGKVAASAARTAASKSTPSAGAPGAVKSAATTSKTRSKSKTKAKSKPKAKKKPAKKKTAKKKTTKKKKAAKKKTAKKKTRRGK